MTSPTTPTISFSPYSGSHYSPDNPRSIGPAAVKNFDAFLARIPTFAGSRVLVRRCSGMLKPHADAKQSWELQDYRWLTPDWVQRYAKLGDACRQNGKILAFNIGLRAPGNYHLDHLDMDDALHREALVAACQWYKSIGASELWIDTGGSISHDDVEGDGVQYAVDLAADHGIRLIPEYTQHLHKDCRASVFFRHRRNEGDAGREPINRDWFHRETFCCVGYNKGGVEPPTEVSDLSTRHSMVAWNPDAVAQYAPATPIEGDPAPHQP